MSARARLESIPRSVRVYSVRRGIWLTSFWRDGELVHAETAMVVPGLGAVPWGDQPAPADVDDLDELEQLARALPCVGFGEAWRRVAWLARSDRQVAA